MPGGYNHQYGFDTGALPPGFPDTEPPPTYCTIKFFRHPSKPWLQSCFNPSDSYQISVPRNVKVKELMSNYLGCRNPDNSKNVVIELAERVNGTYSKGYVMRADNSERANKTLAELGYDGSRSADHNPHVWLWVSDCGID